MCHCDVLCTNSQQKWHAKGAQELKKPTFKKGWPNARGSCHCVVWGEFDVCNLTPAYGEVVSDI